MENMQSMETLLSTNLIGEFSFKCQINSVESFQNSFTRFYVAKRF